MNSTHLFLIVEGETEQAALQILLESHFLTLGAKLQCILIGENRVHSGGGNFSLADFNRHISRLVHSYKGCFISTCFDYYKLGNDWPGYEDIHSKKLDKYAEVCELEASLMKVVHQEYNSDLLWDQHFIPYIQLHEIETLFFAQPDIFASTLGDSQLVEKMQNITRQFHHDCELINNNYNTCPSRRLRDLTNGSYRKGKSSSAHGPIFMQQADLAVLREKCRHFNAWLDTLETSLLKGRAQHTAAS